MTQIEMALKRGSLNNQHTHCQRSKSKGKLNRGKSACDRHPVLCLGCPGPNIPLVLIWRCRVLTRQPLGP